MATHIEGVEIIYSVESKPLGTGGDLKKAINYINDKYFFIVKKIQFLKLI